MTDLLVKYRVIGYRANNSVVLTVLCNEDETDKAHDDVMAHPEVRSTYLVGPLKYRSPA